MPTRLIALAASGLVLIVVALTSCTIVETGYVGVKTTLGTLDPQPLSPGLHFLWPFLCRVTQLDTRLISFEVQSAAASHDLQVVKTKISVQHSFQAELAPATYATIGNLAALDRTVVGPAVMESFKEVTAKYTAEELITKREAVKSQIVTAIQTFITQTLKSKKLEGAVFVSNVAITDFEFSAEFNASIEAKVRAQQEALRAENEKLKRITEAEAKAREVELEADAQAYEIEQISKSRAEAIEREAQALNANPNVLQLRAIEKWKGDVPAYSGTGLVPFVSLMPPKP